MWNSPDSGGIYQQQQQQQQQQQAGMNSSFPVYGSKTRIKPH